jgi:hypothetical protein
VLLPDDHGIIFSRGYYLQSGEFKLFETSLEEMVFYSRIASPNGEDTLFAFLQPGERHLCAVLLQRDRPHRGDAGHLQRLFHL